jgi:hypothetical protein
MEEVATMGINKLTRPSVLLTAACAPSTLSPAGAAPVATPVLAAGWAPISRVHQVQTQAELALVDGRTNGITSSTEINGTNGFMGLGVSVDSKGYVAERGIPPRGRPVW